MLRVKQWVVLVTLLMCLVALPVLAQETTTADAAANSGPTGITTLVILAGLGAMVTVGGLMYVKEHAKNGKEVD